MTTSASPELTTPFEHCLGIIRQASVEILRLLNVTVAEGKDPRWFLEQMDLARLSLGGWGIVAQRLKMDDAQLSQFTLRLRHLQQCVPQYERGQEVSENQMIAALRFITALERLRQQQPLLTYSTDFDTPNEDRQAEAQLALFGIEQMLKALIAQVWTDRTSLHGYLKQHFGADNLRRWLKLGGNDALNGMRFSELAMMVVDKKAFARHYSGLFKETSVLTLFVEPRTTLQMFLEDCRLARNNVIAYQPLSQAQMLLLAHQHRQISYPVQRAYEEGMTRVNPVLFMAADAEGLQVFWDEARHKDRLSGGDRHEVSDGIEGPDKRIPRTAEQREQLISSALWAIVGLMVVGMVAGGLWLFGQPQPDRENSVKSTAITSTITEPDGEVPGPRETLSRMGITWDAFAFRSAIDRNDTRVAELFLQGGMEWKVSWTEQAFPAGNTDVLQLLLHYPSQMDEPRPCRRFITALGTRMSSGGTLTSLHKSYLQRFCTRSNVVERQQYEVDQARQRARAEPSAENRKWVKIQTAIYNVIR